MRPLFPRAHSQLLPWLQEGGRNRAGPRDRAPCPDLAGERGTAGIPLLGSAEGTSGERGNSGKDLYGLGDGLEQGWIRKEGLLKEAGNTDGDWRLSTEGEGD